MHSPGAGGVQDGRVNAEDLVATAIEELYAADPEDFTERRTALAARTRTAGDKAAAKEIAALRKPTRSAYTLNQLARSDPEAVAGLAEVGVELRAAQEALDGVRMRELSIRRRGLVEELADQAFATTEAPSPAAGLRDEVVSTLNAAVADAGVVEQLQTGALVRAARWDGFGFASPPELSVVRPAARSRDRPATSAASAPTKRRGAKAADPDTVTVKGRGRSTAAAAGAEQARPAARPDRAEANQARERRALAEAEEAARDADSALSEAATVEREQQALVRERHELLTDARRRLDEIRLDLRRAEIRQRKAQQRLDRLRK